VQLFLACAAGAGLFLLELGEGDAGPLRHDVGDVFVVHDLSAESRFFSHSRFFSSSFWMQVALAVAQAGGLLVLLPAMAASFSCVTCSISCSISFSSAGGW
jgi:hypothetical protein